jgi:hypothetical protein
VIRSLCAFCTFTEDANSSLLLRLLLGPSRATLRTLVWHVRRGGCTHAGLARLADVLVTLPALRLCVWDVSFTQELEHWISWWSTLTRGVAARPELTVRVHAAPVPSGVVTGASSSRLTLSHEPCHTFGFI